LLAIKRSKPFPGQVFPLKYDQKYGSISLNTCSLTTLSRSSTKKGRSISSYLAIIGSLTNSVRRKEKFTTPLMLM